MATFFQGMYVITPSYNPSLQSNSQPIMLCVFPASSNDTVDSTWDISCYCCLPDSSQSANYRSPSNSRSFTRGNTKSNQNLKGQYSGQNSPVSQNAPPLPSFSNSPSLQSSFGQESGYYNEQEPKRFLNEKYAKCSVKGNFLTLAAQPKNVELGEWLAHQRMSLRT